MIEENGRAQSAAAFYKIRETLPKRRAEAFELVWKHPRSTAAELVQTAGLTSVGGRGMAGNLHARLNELIAQGVVRKTGVRICKVTGHRVSEFEATGDLPTKPAKKPKPEGGLSGPSKKLLRDLWTLYPSKRFVIAEVQRLAEEHSERAGT